MIKQKDIPRLIDMLDKKATVAREHYEVMKDSDNPQTRECCIQALAEFNIYTKVLEAVKHSDFILLSC